MQAALAVSILIFRDYLCPVLANRYKFSITPCVGLIATFKRAADTYVSSLILAYCVSTISDGRFFGKHVNFKFISFGSLPVLSIFRKFKSTDVVFNCQRSHH